MDGSTGYGTRGMWGGLILCGDGELNTFDGEDEIEGIVDVTGQDRHVYGGDGSTFQNSGIVRYVSLRHASTSMGISQFENGLETNALTLCGVGEETTVEFVEAIASGDDGVQVFGGMSMFVTSVWRSIRKMDWNTIKVGKAKDSLFLS